MGIWWERDKEEVRWGRGRRMRGQGVMKSEKGGMGMGKRKGERMEGKNREGMRARG
jgi:hypothetical protein